MERTERFENDARELSEQMAPRLEEAREHLRDAHQRVSAFIKERPGTCLLAALAIGFVIGRAVRR